MSLLLPFCPDGLGAVPEMRSWEVAGGICMKRRKNKNKPKTGMRTLKSTKREAVHQEEAHILFFKEKTFFSYSFCPAGERWNFQKIVRNFPPKRKRIKKFTQNDEGEKKREKKMSCHKSRRKLVMWFEWLEAPARSSLPATTQTTTFPPGLYRTPSRNKDRVKRKRNIIYMRLVVLVRVVESTPAHLYSTHVYTISPTPCCYLGF